MRKILIYLFVVTFILALLPINFTEASSYCSSTLKLTARDANGNLLPDVNFNIYEQLSDTNGSKYFASKLKSGKIGSLGWQEVTVPMTCCNKTYAIEYYKSSQAAGKFNRWDVYIAAGSYVSVDLWFSSVNVIIKDSGNILLKDFKYDIYSTANDIYGQKAADKKIWSYQSTSPSGQKSYYIAPGVYILRPHYPRIDQANVADYKFTVTERQNLNLTYVVSSVNVAVQLKNNGYVKYAPYKIFQKKTVANYTEYKEIAQLNTGENGYAKLYLPDGDYQIAYKNLADNFDRIFTFSLYSSEKTLIYYRSVFIIRVLNPDYTPVVNRSVRLYKYINNKKDKKIMDQQTDINGYLQKPLDEGNYIGEIGSSMSSLPFIIDSFYLSENTVKSIDYILSGARVYVQNPNGQYLTNQGFGLYKYETDLSGNLVASKKYYSFNTGDQGYAQFELPANKYIIKVNNIDKLYSVNILYGKLNNIYLNLQNNEDCIACKYTASSYTSSNTAVNNTNSNINYALGSLYDKDSDNDGLSDFEEYYFYTTNPFKFDSDNDSYNDAIEIRNGYNPNGGGRYSYIIYAYDKPRLSTLSFEEELALELKTELAKILGNGNINLSTTNWQVLIKAYIYGGYSPNEIAYDIKYGPNKVNPNIVAKIWRTR